MSEILTRILKSRKIFFSYFHNENKLQISSFSSVQLFYGEKMNTKSRNWNKSITRSLALYPGWSIMAERPNEGCESLSKGMGSYWEGESENMQHTKPKKKKRNAKWMKWQLNVIPKRPWYTLGNFCFKWTKTRTKPVISIALYFTRSFQWLLYWLEAFAWHPFIKITHSCKIKCILKDSSITIDYRNILICYFKHLSFHVPLSTWIFHPHLVFSVWSANARGRTEHPCIRHDGSDVVGLLTTEWAFNL